MGDEILGQTIDARQPAVGIRGQGGQLLVKTSGKVQQDIAGVPLQNVLVIKDPIGRRRGFLFQAARCGKIRADLTDPLTGLLETLEQFKTAMRLQVHLLLPGMTLRMLNDLGRGKLCFVSPRLGPQLALRMHDEQRRRNIAAFPQQSHRTR